MANPYESPQSNPAGDRRLTPVVGASFYTSLLLSILLFLFLPVFPLTYFNAIIGTIWGLVGIVLAWLNVRGRGSISAMALSGFYAFMLFVTWEQLLDKT